MFIKTSSAFKATLIKAFLILAVFAVIANAQWDESSFPGVEMTAAAAFSWSSSSNDLSAVGITFGVLPEIGFTNWASALTCTSQVTSNPSPGDCFKLAVARAVDMATAGVDAVPLTQDSANMLILTAQNNTMWYVNENDGQGSTDGTVGATAAPCPNSLPRLVNTPPFLTSNLGTGGYAIKVTCKSACDPTGAPSSTYNQDLEVIGFNAASQMMNTNSNAARFAILNQSGNVLGRCRITVSLGDQYTVSRCPDYIPPSGCQQVAQDTTF